MEESITAKGDRCGGRQRELHGMRSARVLDGGEEWRRHLAILAIDLDAAKYGER